MSEPVAVGIDIGGTKISGGLVDADGVIFQRARRDTPHRSTHPAVVEQAMIFRGIGWVSLKDLDLPAPALSRDAAVSAEGVAGEPLNWCQAEALTIAGRGLGVRRRDLMARCRISREAARRHLTSLVARGLLRRVGQGRSTLYTSV